ncbi:MAG: T9SS type A sorting domain-containing protein [Flavobacterium sp.]|nr:T9SS type A sorting domain-containing protein [Flavobacterium sp.]
MKLFIFLLLTINCFCQTPVIEWQKSYGGTNYDNARSVAQTSDGGYIVVGNTSSNDGNVTQSFGNGDILIIKINSLGIVEWQKTYGGFNTEFINSIQQTNDDGFILSGFSKSNNGAYSTNHGNNDYLILKLNSNGDIDWQKNYGGTGEDLALDAIQTNDGGYAVIGQTASNNGNLVANHGLVDYWVLKLFPDGNIEWQNTYGGSGNDTGEKIQQTNDGGYILIGFSNSTNGDIISHIGASDMWILKINSGGIIEWEKSIGTVLNDYGYGIVQTNDLGYVLSGTTNSSSNNNVMVTKLNSSGNVEWQNTYGGNGDDFNYSIQTDSDGGYIFIGYSESTNNNFSNNHGNYDIWLTKINGSGDFLWQKLLGGTNYDFAFCVKKTTDNGYIVAGDTGSTNGDVQQNFGLSDFWLIKLSPEQLSNSIFQQENLFIYPNPTTNLINLKFPHGITIDKIVITELTGKIILTLTENITQINTENLSNGVYFVQAFSEEKKYQSKFIKQ